MQPSTMILFLTVLAVLTQMGYTKRDNCRALGFTTGNATLLPEAALEQLPKAGVYVFPDDPVAFYRGFPKVGSTKQFYAVCVLYWEWRNEPFHCGKLLWNGKSFYAKGITQKEFRSFYKACSGQTVPVELPNFNEED